MSRRGAPCPRDFGDREVEAGEFPSSEFSESDEFTEEESEDESSSESEAVSSSESDESCCF